MFGSGQPGDGALALSRGREEECVIARPDPLPASFVRNLLGGLTAICILTSLLLVVFQWNSASQLEKIALTAFVFLSSLAGISIYYADAKARWLKEPDPKIRLKGLNNLKREFRKMLILYIIPFFLAAVVIIVWQLLMGKP